MATTLPYELDESNEEEEQEKEARAIGDGNAAVDASERTGFDSLATTGIHHPSVNTDMGVPEAIADIESTSEPMEEAQADGITQQGDPDEPVDFLAEINALQATISRVLQEAAQETAGESPDSPTRPRV